MFKFIDGDITIENKDLVILTEVEKAEQDIIELIKQIVPTYRLRKKTGIEWMSLLGKLINEDRIDLIISAMRDKISKYPNVDVKSIKINLKKIENRKAIFNVSLRYNAQKIKFDYNGGF